MRNPWLACIWSEELIKSPSRASSKERHSRSLVPLMRRQGPTDIQSHYRPINSLAERRRSLVTCRSPAWKLFNKPSLRQISVTKASRCISRSTRSRVLQTCERTIFLAMIKSSRYTIEFAEIGELCPRYCFDVLVFRPKVLNAEESNTRRYLWRIHIASTDPIEVLRNAKLRNGTQFLYKRIWRDFVPYKISLSRSVNVL